MRFTLRQFQKVAVGNLLRKLKQAKREFLEDGVPQAITFSAPTASGKTVMMTSLIERVLFGKGSLEEFDDPEFDIDPDATFLWLSDSPQLNQQSLEKMTLASSSELMLRLRTVESTFDARTFEPGNVFFLNSQKLSVAGLLTNPEKGEEREFTIWETINNTIKRQAGSFYVVIDEAHRGMRRTQAEKNQATGIIQKFIFGDGERLALMPLIIGVSATPERFNDVLTGGGRTRRAVDIAAQEPREAGLIKDFVLIGHPKKQYPTEWTLLGAACQDFQQLSEVWEQYCVDNSEDDIVRPVLVVQVEDATPTGGASDSKTSLERVLDVVTANVPGITNSAFGHCLESGKTLLVGDAHIRYVEPHRIEYDPSIRVVIFKMALTTGWDCPRAEVMFSFRRATDATYIAQLVGRIVRTPLAKRIQGNDLLNSVVLYLPFFDRQQVGDVVKALQGEGGESKGSDMGDEDDFQTLTVAPDNQGALESYKALPTYTSQERRKVSDIRRAARLAFDLAMDGWETEAEHIKDGMRDRLAEVGKLRNKDVAFSEKFNSLSTVRYRVLRVENGAAKPDDMGEERTLTVSQQDVEKIFSRSFVTLTEDLARAYINKLHDPDDINSLWKLKLQAFLLSQDEKTVGDLDAQALNLISETLKQKKSQIKNLSIERQGAYKKIHQISRHFESSEPTVPVPIRLKTDKNAVALNKHLFVDSAGNFKAYLNSWEAKVLEHTRQQSGFACWVRNYPRTPWSIAYIYERSGEMKPGFPDFVVFRSQGKDVVPDLLEPHQGEDSLAKAHGLCRYAEEHGVAFGRIQLIRVVGDEIQALDFNDPNVRQKTLAAKVDGALDSLFNTFGKK